LHTSRLINIVIVLALCQVANGQPAGFSRPGAQPEESLEHRVTDSDVIVLGTIINTAGNPPFLINIAVLEAFKGNCPAEVAAFTDRKGSPTPSGVHDLIFLRRQPVPGRESIEYVVRSVVRLDDTSGVYLSDLTHVTATDEILAATRRAIAYGGPEERKSAVLLFQPGVKGMPNQLVVPVDSRLEAHARRWAEARDAHARVRAAQALSHFRSAENIEVLKGLLGDTAMPYSSGTGKWKRGVYAVREEAYTTLASWGVGVEMPELEGPMYRYRPAFLDWAVFVPIVVIGWVLLNVAVRGSQFRLGRSLLQGLTFLSLIAAAGLVVLWVRSWFVVDELMYPVRTAHHQVASYRGGVHYLVMLDAEMKEGPLYGQFDLSNVEDQWGLDQHTRTGGTERLGFGFAVGRMVGPGEASHQYRVVRVPYYPLVAGAIVLPVLGMWHWWRGWRRVSRGMCRACGYDLRESRGRCPECGEREPVAV
jgi:hypothetical protein